MVARMMQRKDTVLQARSVASDALQLPDPMSFAMI
jgi:hypothetical protein